MTTSACASDSHSPGADPNNGIPVASTQIVVKPTIPGLVITPGGGCTGECARVNAELAAQPGYYGGLNRSTSLTVVREHLLSEWMKVPRPAGFEAQRRAVWAARDATYSVNVNRDHSLINLGVALHYPKAVTP